MTLNAGYGAYYESNSYDNWSGNAHARTIKSTRYGQSKSLQELALEEDTRKRTRVRRNLQQAKNRRERNKIIKQMKNEYKNDYIALDEIRKSTLLSKKSV